VIGKKPVVLEFWATWCPVCEGLEPALKAAHAKYGAQAEFILVAVGVNQNPRSIKRHLERRPLPGRMLWDGAGAAVRSFEAPTTSYVVVLDAAGRVVYTGTGEDQDLSAAVAKAVAR
jgi:thiol-disulfide isomerase/thioredoxin